MKKTRYKNMNCIPLRIIEDDQGFQLMTVTGITSMWYDEIWKLYRRLLRENEQGLIFKIRNIVPVSQTAITITFTNNMLDSEKVYDMGKLEEFVHWSELKEAEISGEMYEPVDDICVLCNEIEQNVGYFEDDLLGQYLLKRDSVSDDEMKVDSSDEELCWDMWGEEIAEKIKKIRNNAKKLERFSERVHLTATVLEDALHIKKSDWLNNETLREVHFLPEEGIIEPLSRTITNYEAQDFGVVCHFTDDFLQSETIDKDQVFRVLSDTVYNSLVHDVTFLDRLTYDREFLELPDGLSMNNEQISVLDDMIQGPILNVIIEEDECLLLKLVNPFGVVSFEGKVFPAPNTQEPFNYPGTTIVVEKMQYISMVVELLQYIRDINEALHVRVENMSFCNEFTSIVTETGEVCSLDWPLEKYSSITDKELLENRLAMYEMMSGYALYEVENFDFPTSDD